MHAFFKLVILQEVYSTHAPDGGRMALRQKCGQCGTFIPAACIVCGARREKQGGAVSTHSGASHWRNYSQDASAHSRRKGFH